MTPDGVRAAFEGKGYLRVALEAGAQSGWVTRLLRTFRYEPVVANPRKLKAISANERKSDRNDALMLAKLVWADASLLHLWSLDSDFDCRGTAPGESYSITDHCGQVELLTASIDPRYLARQIKQAGLDQGFMRDYRPSLALMEDLEVELPMKGTDFDTDLMQEWTTFQEELERQDGELRTLLS